MVLSLLSPSHPILSSSIHTLSPSSFAYSPMSYTCLERVVSRFAANAEAFIRLTDPISGLTSPSSSMHCTPMHFFFDFFRFRSTSIGQAAPTLRCPVLIRTNLHRQKCWPTGSLLRSDSSIYNRALSLSRRRLTYWPRWSSNYRLFAHFTQFAVFSLGRQW